MEELNIKNEKVKLQTEIENWFVRVKKQFTRTPTLLEEQIHFLTIFRSNNYEALNQLQHRALIIESARTLQEEFPQINKWKWHPEQTSKPDEADLMGYSGNTVIVSVEVTASMKPVGVIDTRMRNTLRSLSEKKGKLFYFVQTEKMLSRAKHKIKTNGWNIVPRQLEDHIRKSQT